MASHPLNSLESAQTSSKWQEPGAGMSRVRRPGLGMRTMGWCVLRGVLVRTGDWELRLRRGRGLSLQGSPPTTPTSGEEREWGLRQQRRVGETLEMNKLGSEPQAAAGAVSTSCHVTIRPGHQKWRCCPKWNLMQIQPFLHLNSKLNLILV